MRKHPYLICISVVVTGVLVFFLWRSLSSNTISSDRASAVILDNIRKGDRAIQSFDIAFSIKAVFPDPVEWQTWVDDPQLESTMDGRMVFDSGKYWLQHSIHAVHVSSKVWEFSSENSFDGETYMEDTSERDSKKASRQPLNLGWNPMHMGVMVEDYQSMGGLLDLTKYHWTYVGEETQGDVQCQRIDGKSRRLGTLARLWVDPARGYRMIRLEIESPPELHPMLEDRTEILTWETTSLEQFGEAVWIPTRVKSKILSHLGSDTLTYNLMEWELDVKNVNMDVDPSRFVVDLPAD